MKTPIMTPARRRTATRKKRAQSSTIRANVERNIRRAYGNETEAQIHVRIRETMGQLMVSRLRFES